MHRNARFGSWRARAALLLLGLALVASAAPTTAPREVTPAKLTAALARLDALDRQTLSATGLAGVAIVVVHDDKVV